MNNQNKESKINIQYIKTITDENEIFKHESYINKDIFTVYNINSKNENKNCKPGYIASPNKKTKNIDIYEIIELNNINKILSLEIKYESIEIIKHFYDKYNNKNYLTALINETQQILIWEIIDKNNYKLLIDFSKKIKQGGYSLKYSFVHFKNYLLFFHENRTYLTLFYIHQKSCGYSQKCILIYEIFDEINDIQFPLKIIKNKKRYKNENENENNFEKFFKKVISIKDKYYPFTDFIEVYIIKINNKIYIAELNHYCLYLYNIFIICSRIQRGIAEAIKANEYTSEQIEINLEKKIGMRNINYEKYKIDCKGKYGVIIEDNNNMKYLLGYSFDSEYYNNDKNGLIFKYDLKNFQLIYTFLIDNRNDIIQSLTNWNKKYFIIVKNNKLFCFNAEKGRFEKDLNTENASKLINRAKKLIINGNKELLIVNSIDGKIDLWCNQSY